MAEISECYRILELRSGASPEEVEAAYADLTDVWRPGRFSGNPRLMRIAEKKIARIEMAHKALVASFASRGLRSGANGKKGGNGHDRREARVCGDPRCAGTIGLDGCCRKCGLPDASRDRPHILRCPACGTPNMLKDHADYLRGACTSCQTPFLEPEGDEEPREIREAREAAATYVQASRKRAYMVVAIVAAVLAWFFFWARGDRAPLPGADSGPRSLVPQSAYSTPAPVPSTAPAPVGEEAAPAAEPDSTENASPAQRSAQSGDATQATGTTESAAPETTPPAADPAPSQPEKTPVESRPEIAEGGADENFEILMDRVFNGKDGRMENAMKMP